MLTITRLDHRVLTVKNIPASVEFYVTVLGLEHVTFGANRHALRFNRQKINLHQTDQAIEPGAASPLPGTADLCFITSTPLVEAIAQLRACGIEIIEGPVQRTGATGPLLSFYLRDPDGNLIEIANELSPA